MSLDKTRKIKMLLREYYYQYAIVAKASNHRLWIDGYDTEASTVAPSSTYVPILYYRVTFIDGTTVTLHKHTGITVEILGG